MPDLEERITALEENAASVKTDLDAIIGRLTPLENTVQAMGDALKSIAPDNVVSVNGDITAIKAGVNDLSKRIFGDVVFSEPPPVETPAA